MLDYPRSTQNQSCERNAWGAWLSEIHPWDWFVTLTFRDPKEEVGYDRRGIAYCRGAVKAFMREARWTGGARGRPFVPVGVFAIERHSRGSPHVHGLVLSPGRRMDMVDWGWEKYGITRVEAVRDRGAAFYVTKYILKGGPETLILDHLTKSSGCGMV